VGEGAGHTRSGVADPPAVNNKSGGHSRTTALVVLLLPAIVLGGFSMWFFEARWIGVAVALVGVAIAALASVRGATAGDLVLLVVIEVVMLMGTAVVGFAIDCSRHCS